jgi:hypothetical protein
MIDARTQAAVVRALIDEFEHVSAHGEAAQCLRTQLIEELARLSCLIMDVATTMSETCPLSPWLEDGASVS